MRGAEDRWSDIRDAAARIRDFVGERDEAAFIQDFAHDAELADAICFRFIVIGEAVRALIDETGGDLTERYPEVDWRGYADLRNLLAHQYFRVEAAALWPAIRDELPLLATIAAEEGD